MIPNRPDVILLLMSKSKILPTKLANARLIPWKKMTPLSTLKLERGSKAGVVLDKDGVPRLFIFDTFALLDVLSAIDEAIVDKLPHKDYYSRKSNPAGWLIDELETKLPLNPEYIDSLKAAIGEAEKRGWVPFEKIQAELSL